MPKKFFEPITKTITNTSEKIHEQSKDTAKAIEDNDKSHLGILML